MRPCTEHVPGTAGGRLPAAVVFLERALARPQRLAVVVAQRAELLPEEQAAGSDDAEAQAEAILEESDERTERPEKTRRESTQTPD